MEAKATRLSVFGLSRVSHESAIPGPSSLQNLRKPRATVVSASRRQPRAGKKKNPTTSHPSPASPPPDSAQAPLPTHSPPSTTRLIPTVLRGDPSGAHPSIPTPTTSRDRKGFGTPPSRNQLQSTAEPDRGEDGEEGGGGGDNVPREKVFVACAVTSGTLGALGVAVREASHRAAESSWPIHDCIHLMPLEFARWHVGIGVGVGLIVAVGREILLRVWPSLYEATQTSNRQALGRLQPLDLLWVATLPAAGEEVLFRGAFLPLLSPDWLGATISGCVFGALHLTGGRNKAFAIWASLVGSLYGATALATRDVGAPLVAHAVANLVAGGIWKYNNQGRI